MLSFDTAGKSDAEVMLLYGMREEESMSTYLTRTKGLIVLMAAVIQVGGHCVLFGWLPPSSYYVFVGRQPRI